MIENPEDRLKILVDLIFEKEIAMLELLKKGNDVDEDRIFVDKLKREFDYLVCVCKNGKSKK